MSIQRLRGVLPSISFRTSLLILILASAGVFAWVILWADNFSFSNVKTTSIDPAIRTTQEDHTSVNRRISHTNISTDNVPHQLYKDQLQKCQRPVTKIVYIKISKTGSGTLTKMLDRYGISRNLTFAVPKGFTHLVHHPFEEHTYRYKEMIDHGRFDMFTNHGTYNRKELEQIVSNATYITSMRQPVAQFESLFNEFRLHKKYKNGTNNPLAAFFKNNHNGMQDNYQTRYLGETNIANSERYFRELFDRLDKEFSLVIIREYFIESLILLKNMFCWTLNDLLYIQIHVRHDSERVSKTHLESVSNQIEKFNYADMKMYSHFNVTLWKRIESQPDQAQFWRDVRELRNMLSHVETRCIKDTGRYVLLRGGLALEDKKFCEIFSHQNLRDNIPIKKRYIDDFLNRTKFANRTNSISP